MVSTGARCPQNCRLRSKTKHLVAAAALPSAPSPPAAESSLITVDYLLSKSAHAAQNATDCGASAGHPHPLQPHPDPSGSTAVSTTARSGLSRSPGSRSRAFSESHRMRLPGSCPDAPEGSADGKGVSVGVVARSETAGREKVVISLPVDQQLVEAILAKQRYLKGYAAALTDALQHSPSATLTASGTPPPPQSHPSESEATLKLSEEGQARLRSATRVQPRQPPADPGIPSEPPEPLPPLPPSSRPRVERERLRKQGKPRRVCMHGIPSGVTRFSKKHAALAISVGSNSTTVDTSRSSHVNVSPVNTSRSDAIPRQSQPATKHGSQRAVASSGALQSSMHELLIQSADSCMRGSVGSGPVAGFACAGVDAGAPVATSQGVGTIPWSSANKVNCGHMQGNTLPSVAEETAPQQPDTLTNTPAAAPSRSFCGEGSCAAPQQASACVVPAHLEHPPCALEIQNPRIHDSAVNAAPASAVSNRALPAHAQRRSSRREKETSTLHAGLDPAARRSDHAAFTPRTSPRGSRFAPIWTAIRRMRRSLKQHRARAGRTQSTPESSVRDRSFMRDLGMSCEMSVTIPRDTVSRPAMLDYATSGHQASRSERGSSAANAPLGGRVRGVVGGGHRHLSRSREWRHAAMWNAIGCTECKPGAATAEAGDRDLHNALCTSLQQLPSPKHERPSRDVYPPAPVDGTDLQRPQTLHCPRCHRSCKHLASCRRVVGVAVQAGEACVSVSGDVPDPAVSPAMRPTTLIAPTGGLRVPPAPPQTGPSAAPAATTSSDCEVRVTLRPCVEVRFEVGAAAGSGDGKETEGYSQPVPAATAAGVPADDVQHPDHAVELLQEVHSNGSTTWCTAKSGPEPGRAQASGTPSPDTNTTEGTTATLTFIPQFDAVSEHAKAHSDCAVQVHTVSSEPRDCTGPSQGSTSHIDAMDTAPESAGFADAEEPPVFIMSSMHDRVSSSCVSDHGGKPRPDSNTSWPSKFLPSSVTVSPPQSIMGVSNSILSKLRTARSAGSPMDTFGSSKSMHMRSTFSINDSATTFDPKTHTAAAAGPSHAYGASPPVSGNTVGTPSNLPKALITSASLSFQGTEGSPGSTPHAGRNSSSSNRPASRLCGGLAAATVLAELAEMSAEVSPQEEAATDTADHSVFCTESSGQLEVEAHDTAVSNRVKCQRSFIATGDTLKPPEATFGPQKLSPRLKPKPSMPPPDTGGADMVSFELPCPPGLPTPGPPVDQDGAGGNQWLLSSLSSPGRSSCESPSRDPSLDSPRSLHSTNPPEKPPLANPMDPGRASEALVAITRHASCTAIRSREERERTARGLAAHAQVNPVSSNLPEASVRPDVGKALAGAQWSGEACSAAVCVPQYVRERGSRKLSGFVPTQHAAGAAGAVVLRAEDLRGVRHVRIPCGMHVVVDTRGMTFDGVQFSGHSARKTAVVYMSGVAVTFKNCLFDACSIMATGGASCWLEWCHFTHARTACVCASGHKTSVWARCTSVHACGEAIAAHDGARVVVENCDLSRTTVNCMHAQHWGSVFARRCSVASEQGYAGWAKGEGSKMCLRGCTVGFCKRGPLYASEGARVTLDGLDAAPGD